MYEFISKFVENKLKEGPLTEEFTAPKAFLYQMYFVIAKLDANHLACLDFLINFGVTQESRNKIMHEMEHGGSYEEISENTFKTIPFG